MSRKQKGSWLAAIVRENRQAKLLSIILSISIFFGIRSMIGNRVEIVVPVEVEVEPGIAIMELEPRTVSVIFEGARAELRRLEDDPPVARLSSSVTTSTNEIIEIRRRDVSGAPVARVVEVTPSQVRVKYDREAKKVMPVARPTIKGSPLRGTIKLDVKPRMVDVTGPRQQLEELLSKGYQVQTEPIDVDGRVQSFSKTVKLLPPEEIVVSAMAPETVEVRVTIVTETTLKEVPGVPVMAAYVPRQAHVYGFEPTNVVVRLSGRKDVLEGVDLGEIMALVDCRGLAEGTHEAEVHVYMPPSDDVVSVDAVPANVRVLVDGGSTNDVTVVSDPPPEPLSTKD